MARKKSIGALALLVASALALGVVVFAERAQILALLEWIRGLGPAGPVFFVALYALLVVLLVPGTVLTLGAGFLFGVAAGSAYVVIGFTLGATGAFLIARHLFSERVTRYLLHHPKLQVLDREFVREGWKVVLLTRLVPFFPGKLSNYFFGLARFRLLHFVLGTLFGLIPLAIVNVYLGSLLGDLALLGTGAFPRRTGLQWSVSVFGLIIAGLAALYIIRVARRALGKTLDSEIGDKR